MTPDRTAAQAAHQLLGLVALFVVAITLFLVGLAAFRDTSVPTRVQSTQVQRAVPLAAATTPSRTAIADESDKAVDRILWGALAGLAIVVAMFGLAAFGEAPAAFIRLTLWLLAFSTLNVGLVLLRDAAAALAAALVLTATATLVVAARIVGRHALVDSPWHSTAAAGRRATTERWADDAW
jgi:hypothetical protein